MIPWTNYVHQKSISQFHWMIPGFTLRIREKHISIHHTITNFVNHIQVIITFITFFAPKLKSCQSQWHHWNWCHPVWYVWCHPHGLSPAPCCAQMSFSATSLVGLKLYRQLWNCIDNTKIGLLDKPNVGVFVALTPAGLERVRNDYVGCLPFPSLLGLSDRKALLIIVLPMPSTSCQALNQVLETHTHILLLCLLIVARASMLSGVVMLGKVRLSSHPQHPCPSYLAVQWGHCGECIQSETSISHGGLPGSLARIRPVSALSTRLPQISHSSQVYEHTFHISPKMAKEQTYETLQQLFFSSATPRPG